MPGENRTTQTDNKTTTTQPWAPTHGLLQGILGKLGGELGGAGLTAAEEAALRGLAGNSGYMNQFAPQAAGLAGTLLAGGGPDRGALVNDAYAQYRGALAPFARGDYVDPAGNPALQKYLDVIGDDAQRRISAMYAGAGRDPAGAGGFGQSLGRGLAEGQAPVLLDAYNKARADQRSAIEALYGAGGQTAGLLSQFDQAALANRQAGLGVAQAAQGFANDPYTQQLAIEAQRRGIPLANLQRIAGMTVPIAGLGGTSNTVGTTTTTQQQDPTQAIVGGILGGIGLLSGNPMMAMGGLGSAVGQPMSVDPRRYGGGYLGYAGIPGGTGLPGFGGLY
jgi:hypothetical protein